MRPEELAAGLERILARSPALPGRLASAHLIANPRAGGFTRRGHALRRRAELEALCARAEALPRRPDVVPLSLSMTAEPGHALDLAREVFAANRKIHPAGRASGFALHALMTAGGDGTSLEALSALMELPPEERALYFVLRLPFGTGNDGSEGRDLLSSLGRLLGPCAPAPRAAIRATPSAAGGKAPLWAFNIASLGADAFISDMTNKLKTSFPGDSYKLWVDVASVLYDIIWPSRILSLCAFGQDGSEVRRFARECLLVAVGASGRRQYGSNKAILPDADNVCAVSQMSFWRKLVAKGRISAGRHKGLPEVDLFSARRLEIAYPAALLFQADGEVTRLEVDDFPLAVEVLPDSYNVLEGAAAS